MRTTPSTIASRLAGAGLGLAALVLAGCGAAPASAPASPPASSAANASVSPSAKPSALASAAAATSKPAVGATAPTRLAASQNVTGNAPVWLTQQAGLLKQNGLNAEVQSINATNGIKTLVAGQIDAFIGGSAEAVTARAAGAPITIVATLGDRFDMVMTTAKDITSPEQARGKVVGVPTRASTVGIGTVALFKKYGLQPDKDYTILETGSDNTYPILTAALTSNKVQAAALAPDFSRKATADGKFNALVDMAKAPDLLTAGSSLTFSSSYVQQHPVEVQKTVDALLLGRRYWRDHKDEAEALLRNIYKMTDQQDIDFAYQRQIDLVAKDPTPRPDLYPDLIAAVGQISPEVKTLDLSTVLEPKFAQDAVKRGLAD